MNKKSILSVLIILSLLLLTITIVSASTKSYTCHITVKENMQDDPDCAEFVKDGHKCKLSGNSDMEWMAQMNTCIGYCLPDSKMPEKCAELNLDGVNPTKSSTREDHHDEDKVTEDDCNEYEKFKRNKCILRTEKECFNFELWDGAKCEMRCDLDMTWNGAVCVDTEDPYGLLPMGLNSQRVVDNGKVKMGVIRHGNGAYVFSLDGIHYYPTPEQAKRPTVLSNMGKAISSWFSFKAKSADPDQKMMEEVADVLLDEIKEEPLSFEKANKAIGKSAISALTKKGIEIFIGPMAKGIALPGNSIAALAKHGKTVQFEADIVEYIKLRKSGIGKESVKLESNTLQDYSTVQLFSSTKEMYDSFEVAYQRFTLAKTLK